MRVVALIELVRPTCHRGSTRGGELTKTPTALGYAIALELRRFGIRLMSGQQQKKQPVLTTYSDHDYR